MCCTRTVGPGGNLPFWLSALSCGLPCRVDGLRESRFASSWWPSRSRAGSRNLQTILRAISRQVRRFRVLVGYTLLTDLDPPLTGITDISTRHSFPSLAQIVHTPPLLSIYDRSALSFLVTARYLSFLSRRLLATSHTQTHNASLHPIRGLYGIPLA